jgi:hypothetical protein
MYTQHKYPLNHIWNLMKHEFKQGDNLVLGFWLGEAHVMFITPSLNIKSG